MEIRGASVFSNRRIHFDHEGPRVGAVNNMEQRWSQRRQVALDVDVWHQGAILASCRTRDVGLGGVFLELGDSVPEKDLDLELVFWLGSEDQKTRHRLKARVVRLDEGGVGLAFRDFDTSSFRALQAILRQSTVVRSH